MFTNNTMDTIFAPANKQMHIEKINFICLSICLNILGQFISETFNFFFFGGGCCKIRPILLSIINLNQQHITDYKIDNAIFQIKTNIDQIPSS